MNTLTIMSYNIRNSNDDTGENAWSNRKAALVALIKSRRPDILCMQEALPDQMQYLRAMLPDYDFFGVGRDDGGMSGEFSPVFFRRSLFENVGAITVWLSETPLLPSCGWDAHHNRICTLVALKEKETGQVIGVASLHLEHAGPIAQVKGAEVAREAALSSLQTQCFLAGDYNCAVGSKPYQVMTQEPLRDARLDAPERSDLATFHGFGKKELTLEASPIDHIFYTPGLYHPVRAEVLAIKMNGRYPSDHFPLLVTFQNG